MLSILSSPPGIAERFSCVNVTGFIRHNKIVRCAEKSSSQYKSTNGASGTAVIGGLPSKLCQTSYAIISPTPIT